MTPRMTKMTAQELLRERRQNVREMRAERDPMAKEMLKFHISMIDAELERRRSHGKAT